MIGELHLRFETCASKPPVFRCTEPLIASAKARTGLAKIRYLPKTLRSGARRRRAPRNGEALVNLIDPARGY